MTPFRKAIVFSSFLFFLSFAALLYTIRLHPILREDSSKYVKYGASKESKLPLAPFQTRTYVAKDLWIAHEKDRTHCHIESPHSLLQFVLEEAKPSLIEKLEEPKIWIYDQVKSNSEGSKVANVDDGKNPSSGSFGIRYLRGSEGVINYSKQTLTTEETFLSTYDKSHANRLFSGFAKHLVLSFDAIPPSFQASDFSLHSYSQGVP